MKKRIALEGLKAGVKFSQDVYIDDRNLFVPANIAIKQKDIDVLRKWGIAYVITEGDAIPEAKANPEGKGLAANKTPDSSITGFTGSRELYRGYTDLIDTLHGVFEKLRLNEAVEPKTVDQLAQAVLQIVREKRSEIVSAILCGEVQGYDYARAGVNTAILSVVIGMDLKLPSYKLSYLATGALIHDIGMLRVPEGIVRKKGDLTEEESQKVRSHPLHSYRIITKELMYPDDIGVIGLQHHERWDGDGYPRRTASGAIDILSRIVSVVDAFEAMISEKPYRNSMIGYTAMKNLLSDNSRRFDPEILKAFIRGMGIYPIGSIVLLNNAAIARVVEIHADAPLRPKVRVMIDEFAHRYKPDEGDALDLLTEKSLFIARALDPKELNA